MESIDRQEITDLSYKYAASTDDRKGDEFAAVFTHDGTLSIWHHGADAPFASFEGVEQLAKVVQLVEGGGPTFHMITNALVTAEDGETAHGVVNCKADAVGVGEQAGQILTNVVRYHDRYRRTPEGWRIEDRRCIALWNEVKAFAPLG